MATLDYRLVEASRATLVFRCVEKYIDQKTGDLVRVPRDLSLDTKVEIYWSVSTNGGRSWPTWTKLLAAADPDQSEGGNRGYCSFSLAGTECPAAGVAKWRVVVTDVSGKPHPSGGGLLLVEAL